MLKLGIMGMFCVWAATWSIGCMSRDFNNTSETEAAKDITYSYMLPDGKYSVNCSNKSEEEIHTAAELQKAYANPLDQTVCDSSKGIRCVARDGDNRPPWFIVRVAEVGLKPVGSRKFSLPQVCEEIAEAVRNERGVVCSSRDGDNKLPFVLFQIINDDLRQVQNDLRFGSKNHCEDFYSGFTDFEDKALRCYPRDFDGKIPLVIFEYSKTTYRVARSMTKPKEYRSLEECRVGLDN